jgi:phosphinothricin acetyltransferase
VAESGSRRDGSGVTIRQAREDDFDAVAAITNFYIEHTAIHFSAQPVAAADLRGAWLAARERYPFLVARSGGRVLGYAKAGVWRERAAYAWTPECGVYVLHGEHRRGIGRAMYARLFDIMARQGFRSVVAGATLPNEASVRLHLSMGFVAQGVIRQAGWKMGRWWDVAFFQKMLAEGEGDAPELTRVSDVAGE